jgi:hypothetical protein
MTGSDRPDETAIEAKVCRIMQMHVGDVRGLAETYPRLVYVLPMATTASGENPLGIIGRLRAYPTAIALPPSTTAPGAVFSASWSRLA